MLNVQCENFYNLNLISQLKPKTEQLPCLFGLWTIDCRHLDTKKQQVRVRIIKLTLHAEPQKLKISFIFLRVSNKIFPGKEFLSRALGVDR